LLSNEPWGPRLNRTGSAFQVSNKISPLYHYPLFLRESKKSLLNLRTPDKLDCLKSSLATYHGTESSYCEHIEVPSKG